MNFYEQANAHLADLNINERKLFDYVTHNIQTISQKSIREVAQDNFVSTTTIIRFVKKLGFDGYRAFTDSIKITVENMGQTDIPAVFHRKEYSEEFIKNIIETVRVASDKTMNEFYRTVSRENTAIYFYGEGLDREVAHYAYRRFTSMGFLTYFPSDEYEVRSVLTHIHDNDVLFLFSLSGETPGAIHIVEQTMLKSRPTVVSITWSGNNTLQNLSDLDFYVFVDQMTYKGFDMASRVSMIALVDLLTAHIIANGQ